MVVLPFPTSSDTRDRLTHADRANLFARWPKGEVIEVETATSRQFTCFLAAGEDGENQFMIWREPSGQYVRQDTRNSRMARGATLAEVMPAEPGV